MPLKSCGEAYKGFEPYLPSLWGTKDQPKNRNAICHIEIEVAAECIIRRSTRLSYTEVQALRSGI